MKYDKLVRDKIPEIIEKSGKTAVTRMLDDDEYKIYLEKKLDEEVAEFHESKSIKELADIMQVVYTLASVFGYCPADIYSARIEKIIDRGGFENKILLQEVRDE